MGSEEEEKFGSDSASAIKYTLGFIVTLFVAVQAFFSVYRRNLRGLLLGGLNGLNGNELTPGHGAGLCGAK